MRLARLARPGHPGHPGRRRAPPTTAPGAVARLAARVRPARSGPVTIRLATDTGVTRRAFLCTGATTLNDIVVALSKLKIAALMGRYDTVGMDLVNHCVNDIFTCGAEPLPVRSWPAIFLARATVREQA